MNSFTLFFTERFNTIQNYLQTQSFPTEEWLDIFSWRFWIEGGLGTSSEFSLASYGLVFFSIVGLLIFRTYLARAQQRTPVYEQVVNHLTGLVVFIAIMSIFYGFSRAEQIAHLSSRLTILIVLVISIMWFAWFLFILLRRIPSTRRAYLEKERFFRYLPKR